MLLLPSLITPLLLATGIGAFAPPLGAINVQLQPVGYMKKKCDQCSIKLYMTNQDNDNDEYNPRDNFGRSLRGFQSSALKTVIETGDTIVTKRPVPSLAIYENTSYEVVSIYAQSFNEETQQVEKQMLNCIDEDSSENLPSKSQLYISLFSPVHHKEPVVVSPEEVGLTTVRSELGNAALLAVPGFFWIIVASTFYNIYHERTGGSFSDAFWGR
mmetsp:Transcript_12879/g.19861  ORF Transcript_12879/g.19861 Transcript_12879/m.19861 type:complete len:214 (-) Transcript_12879:64-705(-)